MANEEAMRRVGAILRSARKSKGLTQEDLASLIPGQSNSQISTYENGKRDVPRDKVERFAEILGISPISLIPLEEWSRPEEPELNEKEPTMISNRLKEIRKGMGISMRQMAMNIDMPYTTYVSYEKGTREPNIAGLIKLADYFGCTVDYLVRGEAPRTIPEAARGHIMRRFCNTEVI
jgi:transcriptional regulator with XRE-family HTH domain